MAQIETLPTIAVIGLGYVGLPLAVAFSRRTHVIGFDLNQSRIAELQHARDRTGEIDSAELAASKIRFTSNPDEMAQATFYVVTVPTPVTEALVPDLEPLRRASETIGSMLKRGDIVVYESTVYPGATEEVCVPILEKVSGLTYRLDFGVGYSPERINPGDHERRLETITKITSGSDIAVAEAVDAVYGSIITAGTYRASSIRVAEAAKVIENSQRDINIAFMNELSSVFALMKIDTKEVLDAAATKWNFLRFSPGLVGGHCIGVDPYYLTYKAQELGYHPEIILAGRRKNDLMYQDLVRRAMILTVERLGRQPQNALILGATFKENCPDLRNSKVFDVVRELEAFGIAVSVHDALAEQDELEQCYGDRVIALDTAAEGRFDLIVVAVAHSEYASQSATALRRFAVPGGVLFDVKSVFPAGDVDGRL